jgi:hypothetical protein
VVISSGGQFTRDRLAAATGALFGLTFLGLVGPC